MLTLTQLVDSYLDLRRSTGFGMGVHEYLLHNFAVFAAQRDETHIRTRTAIEWAAQAPSEGQRANRLGMLRVFARFAHAEDPRHEVPSERVFLARRIRYRPFIFSPEHLHELLSIEAVLKDATSQFSAQPRPVLSYTDPQQSGNAGTFASRR
jgi:hypothetical protein